MHILAAKNLNRKGYGFEIKKDFYNDAINKILSSANPTLFNQYIDKRKLYEERLLFDNK